MANGNGNGTGGDSDWKIWGIRLGFGIIAALLPITIALAALSYTSLKSELKSDVGRIEVAVQKHIDVQAVMASKQDSKFDDLCKRVGDQGVTLKEHDILLRQPWQQRKEFYLFQQGKGVHP